MASLRLTPLLPRTGRRFRVLTGASRWASGVGVRKVDELRLPEHEGPILAQNNVVVLIDTPKTGA